MPVAEKPEEIENSETLTTEKEKASLESVEAAESNGSVEGDECLEDLCESALNEVNASGEEKTDSDAGPDSSEEQVGDSSAVTSSKEYQALNDKYLRLYAEFDNYRKRTARETIELMQTANAALLEKLIPTLENFHAAFSPEKKATRLEDFEEGIRMIFNAFKDVLENSGLEEINPEGEEFDPNFHDAMLQQNHDTVEEGYVIQVYQKGYKVKSKIIKHAKVIISKGKE